MRSSIFISIMRFCSASLAFLRHHSSSSLSAWVYGFVLDLLDLISQNIPKKEIINTNTTMLR